MLDYLNKVRQYEDSQSLWTNNPYPNTEAIPPKLWQKQILHFSGGTGPYEVAQDSLYLVGYRQIVQDTSWGAKVTSYTRTGTGPIDESQAQVIRTQISQGSSLLTFSGHSATGAFDLSIDEPESWTNYGRYPIILSNGCFAGLIHDSLAGYSERFVLEPKHWRYYLYRHFKPGSFIKGA